MTSLRSRFFLFHAWLLLGLLTSAFAADVGVKEKPFFNVAVVDAPPYAYKDLTGKWEGVSVSLWEQIAKKLGYHYRYVEFPVGNVLQAVARGECALAITGIIPSIDAERSVDFTQPYLASRLVVVFNQFVLLQEVNSFLHALVSNGVIEVFISMMAALMGFSLLIWLAEKNSNDHFSGRLHYSVGSALWFGAVTMTSLGYGDKVPQTFLGRAVTFVWMIAGMLLVALLTGTVVSSITAATEHQSIKHLSDLAHYRNGVMNDAYGARTLQLKGIHTKKFNSYEEGLKALDEKKISAFIGDSISLQYLVARDYPGRLRLASLPTGTIYRMFALYPHFSQKEEINLALLEITTPLEWNTEVEKWTGPLLLGH